MSASGAGRSREGGGVSPSELILWLTSMQWKINQKSSTKTDIRFRAPGHILFRALVDGCLTD